MMGYMLNCEGFGKNLVDVKFSIIHNKVTAYVFRFDNDYGAIVVDGSIIDIPSGYEDGWELNVIRFYDERSEYYILDFTTPVADDVLACATDEDVRNILTQIKEL